MARVPGYPQIRSDVSGSRGLASTGGKTTGGKKQSTAIKSIGGKGGLGLGRGKTAKRHR